MRLPVNGRHVVAVRLVDISTVADEQLCYIQIPMNCCQVQGRLHVHLQHRTTCQTIQKVYHLITCKETS